MSLNMKQRGQSSPILMPIFNDPDATTAEIAKHQSEYFRQVQLYRYQNAIRKLLSNFGFRLGS